MPVDRPTFHESWYRVADLRPRLRSTTQTFRQSYRGRMWHVVRDPSNNQFFRMPEAAYMFVGLLDGKRTVGDAWHICSDQLGDAAPTQVEAIQLLGQLYTSNLIQADLPADTAGMFERYRKRVRREVGGYMMNLLFVRIPLFNPDRFLERWVGVFGWLFSWIGLALWLILVGVGFSFLTGRWDDLISAVQQQEFFKTENLLLLYLSFAVIKAIHEFSHGFACKRFGHDTHTGGAVHTIGIMFLVFMPVPYVDASSSWAFRSKWQRATVGAAGIFAELAVAAVAAIVWSQTSEGQLTNAIAYNIIFIASVSTLIFNGNPLLRFDGYYILSDLLEIPNLQHRCKEYLYYLIRKYIFGVRRATHPSQGAKEKFWLLFYVIASTIYRVFISVRILLFVADKLFFVGILLAMMALVGWLFVPLGKFVRYLGTKEELARTRGRAIAATVVFVGLIVFSIGVIRVPDYGQAEGFIEPRALAEVYIETDGFVEQVKESGIRVEEGGEPLLVARNRELEAERDQKLADRRIAEANLRAQRDEPVAAQVLSMRIRALDAEIDRIQERIGNLQLRPTVSGLWIAPDIDRAPGAYLSQGNRIGRIASVEDVLIRVTADQFLGPRIPEEMGLDAEVELRVKGRADIGFSGIIKQILPAGQKELPSAALGYMVGGSMQVDLEDPRLQRSAQPFFEVRIDPKPSQEDPPTLLSGQRVVVRFEMPEKPLAQRWWRQIRQLVQQRFQT